MMSAFNLNKDCDSIDEIMRKYAYLDGPMLVRIGTAKDKDNSMNDEICQTLLYLKNFYEQ